MRERDRRLCDIEHAPHCLMRDMRTIDDHAEVLLSSPTTARPNALDAAAGARCVGRGIDPVERLVMTERQPVSRRQHAISARG